MAVLTILPKLDFSSAIGISSGFISVLIAYTKMIINQVCKFAFRKPFKKKLTSGGRVFFQKCPKFILVLEIFSEKNLLTFFKIGVGVGGLKIHVYIY